MSFTSKKKIIEDISLYICNSAIQRVHVTQLLGVQIYSKLTFSNHIDYTCKNLSKCVAILAKARKKLTKVCLVYITPLGSRFMVTYTKPVSPHTDIHVHTNGWARWTIGFSCMTGLGT